MNSIDRILGEATRNVRPPTEEELTDPRSAFNYAKGVIGGRFPEGEAAIATDPDWAYRYARDVIGGRFPEGEATIATDPDWAYRYAKNVIRRRFPKGEAAIATDPYGTAYFYAKNVLRRRFPEGEAVIAKSPTWAYSYAKEYLKAFPKAKLEWVMNGWLDWLDL